MTKCIKNGVNNDSICRLLQHLAWENYEISKHVISIIFKSISESEYDQLSHLFEVLLQFLKTEDTLHKLRIEVFLPKYVRMMEEKKKMPKKTKACLEFLQRLIQSDKFAHSWIQQNKDQLAWLNL